MESFSSVYTSPQFHYRINQHPKFILILKITPDSHLGWALKAKLLRKLNFPWRFLHVTVALRSEILLRTLLIFLAARGLGRRQRRRRKQSIRKFPPKFSFDLQLFPWRNTTKRNPSWQFRVLILNLSRRKERKEMVLAYKLTGIMLENGGWGEKNWTELRKFVEVLMNRWRVFQFKSCYDSLSLCSCCSLGAKIVNQIANRYDEVT